MVVVVVVCAERCDDALTISMSIGPGSSAAPEEEESALSRLRTSLA